METSATDDPDLVNDGDVNNDNLTEECELGEDVAQGESEEVVDGDITEQNVEPSE